MKSCVLTPALLPGFCSSPGRQSHWGWMSANSEALYEEGVQRCTGLSCNITAYFQAITASFQKTSRASTPKILQSSVQLPTSPAGKGGVSRLLGVEAVSVGNHPIDLICLPCVPSLDPSARSRGAKPTTGKQPAHHWDHGHLVRRLAAGCVSPAKSRDCPEENGGTCW